MKKKQKQFELISVRAKELRIGDKVLLGDNSLGKIIKISDNYVVGWLNLTFDSNEDGVGEVHEKQFLQKAIYRK